MATMSRSTTLACSLLLAFAFAVSSAAAQDYYDGPPYLSVNSTQVFIALCTGDGSYQPYHRQADYCSAISSSSFPKTKDLLGDKGFFFANGWNAYFAPVSPPRPGSINQQYFNFQLQDGVPSPELLAAVLSGFSKYTVILVEAFVQPDYELTPVSLWVFYNSQVNSLNYNGGGYGYGGDAFTVAYDKFSYTAYKTDSKGSTKAYKPTLCFDFAKGKQC